MRHELNAEVAENAEAAEVSEDERLNAITGKIIAAAIRVHRSLGPGLLESAYEACTAFELVQDGLRRRCQTLWV